MSHLRQSAHLHPSPVPAERREPAPPGGRRMDRNLHELQQRGSNLRRGQKDSDVTCLWLSSCSFRAKLWFTSADEGQNYVSWAAVDLDEPQRCRIAPHLQGQQKGALHILSAHVRGVFGNPACRHNKREQEASDPSRDHMLVPSTQMSHVYVMVRSFHLGLLG